jgi:hypothetical protein
MRFIIAAAAAFNNVRQCFLKLLTIHFLHPLPTCLTGEPKRI